MNEILQRSFISTVLILTLLAVASGQSEPLKLNEEVKFPLRNKEEKQFILKLKKGDYTEISWRDTLERFPNFSVVSPSGRDMTDGVYQQNPFPFVAGEDGEFRLIVRFEETDNDQNSTVSIAYGNVFKLPASAKLRRQKKINGYEIKAYTTSEDEQDGYGSYLLIERNGKLVAILQSGSLVGDGFGFGDDPNDYDYAGGRRSANLFRTTLDKTGDGTPDVAVKFYTGGAHCCFDLHIFELGRDGVRKLRTIEGRDSDIVAIGKDKNGGLILKTGDSNFAYWLTSFAGSPIPTVILTYRNGEYRPDAKLMKKPAPAAAVLRRKAAAARKSLGTQAYVDEENSSFSEAFWGEMLDLMYSGNERAAWQYFDLVWDSRKPGKEKFKQDFLRKLNESQYWRMMRESADRN